MRFLHGTEQRLWLGSPSNGGRGGERRLPYPIGVAGHAVGVLVPAPVRALRTRLPLRPGGLGAVPGTAAENCSCLHWAVCFWDFSNADVVRGPLSPGDSDSIGSWPLTRYTHDL